MIKIGIRKNLFYPMMSMIFHFLTLIIFIIIKIYLEYDKYLVLEVIMFLSEFLSGLILSIYQMFFLFQKKDEEQLKIMGIKLIYNKQSNIKPLDKGYKILFLIFVAAFFDFNQYTITEYLIKVENNSSSFYMDIHLRGLLTIFCAIYCYFLLNIGIGKHQKLSLLILFICIISIISLDLIFLLQNTENFIIKAHEIMSLFISYFLNSYIEVIEKYLLEYDYVNPFKMLFFEGLFGLLLTLPFLIKEANYQMKYNGNIILLIICLSFYFIFKCGRNTYRISTNKIFSPMTRTLTDCMPDPFLIIFFFFKNYHNNKEMEDIFFFVINLIVSIIMVLCGCFYNELFIIYCCNLEYETHHEISLRATILDNSSEYTESEFDNN